MPTTAVATGSASSLPYVLVGAGGACLAIGGVFLCILLATDEALPLATTGSFALSGILLALGWSALLPRREAGYGAVVGSLLLTACWVGGAMIDMGGGRAELQMKGLLGTGGLLVCTMMHLGTLELLALDGAKLAAFAAMGGFGLQLLVISKKFDLSEGLMTSLMWLGVLGTVVFGFALIFGARSSYLTSPSTSAKG